MTKRAPLLSSTGERVSVRARKEARKRLQDARSSVQQFENLGPHRMPGDEEAEALAKQEESEAKADVARARKHPIDTLGEPDWHAPGDYCDQCLRPGMGRTYEKRAAKLETLGRSLPDLDVLLGMLIRLRWKMRAHKGQLESGERELLRSVLEAMRSDDAASDTHQFFDVLVGAADRVGYYEKKVAAAPAARREQLRGFANREVRGAFVTLCRRWHALHGRSPSLDDRVVFEDFAALVHALIIPGTPWVRLWHPVAKAFGVITTEEPKKALEKARKRLAEAKRRRA